MKYKLILLLSAALCFSCTKIIRQTVYEYLPQEVDPADIPDPGTSDDDGDDGLAGRLIYSVQSFGVLPTNTPGVNKISLGAGCGHIYRPGEGRLSGG